MDSPKHRLFGCDDEHEEVITTDNYIAAFYPEEHCFGFPRFRHKAFTGWDACWMGRIPEVTEAVHNWSTEPEVLDFLAGIADRPGQLGLLWKTPAGFRCPVLYLNDEHMPTFNDCPTPGSHWVKTFEDFVAYVDENLEILTLVSFDYHLSGPKTGEDAILYLEEKVVEALSNTPGYTPPVVDINSAMGWTCRQLRGPAERILTLRHRVLDARRTQ